MISLSQIEKEKYCMTSFICGYPKRDDTKELTKQRETHRLRKQPIIACTQCCI